MRRLVFSAAAQRNLRDILRYVARETRNVETGRAFVERLRAQCRKLASLPGSVGRLRPELAAKVRSFPFGNYVVFFQYEEDDFLIVAILEGHLDIESHFRGTD